MVSVLSTEGGGTTLKTHINVSSQVLLHEPLELKRCEILTSIADSISFGDISVTMVGQYAYLYLFSMIEILPEFIGNICYISWYSMS